MSCISHTGGLELITPIQENALNAVLSPIRLNALATNYGANSQNYSVGELLQDLKKGIWTELSAKKPVDYCRRNLQKAYVEKMLSIIDSEQQNTVIMIAEENVQWKNASPQTLGGTPVCLCLYVEDVDAVFAQALKEGAKVKGEMEVKDQFYGDRSGNLTDPFGHNWAIMNFSFSATAEILKKSVP